jgi:hypothetical protein
MPKVKHGAIPMKEELPFFAERSNHSLKERYTFYHEAYKVLALVIEVDCCLDQQEEWTQEPIQVLTVNREKYSLRRTANSLR